MAVLDWGVVQREKDEKEAYEKLKEKIRKEPEHILAFHHILKLERELKEATEKNKEYASFFSLLKKFLPRTPSIHDRIG